MAYQNSSAGDEDSILNPVTETDPEGQQLEEADALSADVDSKFITKTNQKLGEYEQLLAFTLKGNKQLVKQLSEENPELVKRLQRKKRFAGLFDSDESEEAPSPTSNKSELIEALRLIEVEGKRLPSVDIKSLQKDAKFMKKYNALVSGGYDPIDAAEDAFSSAYTKHASNRGSSILSQPSEETPYTPPLPQLTKKEEKFAKAFGLSKEELQKAKSLEE